MIPSESSTPDPLVVFPFHTNPGEIGLASEFETRVNWLISNYLPRRKRYVICSPLLFVYVLVFGGISKLDHSKDTSVPLFAISKLLVIDEYYVLSIYIKLLRGRVVEFGYF